MAKRRPRGPKLKTSYPVAPHGETMTPPPRKFGENVRALMMRFYWSESHRAYIRMWSEMKMAVGGSGYEPSDNTIIELAAPGHLPKRKRSGDKIEYKRWLDDMSILDACPALGKRKPFTGTYEMLIVDGDGKQLYRCGACDVLYGGIHRCEEAAEQPSRDLGNTWR